MARAIARRRSATPLPESAEIMKVCAKASRSLAAFARPSSVSRATVSTLLMTRNIGLVDEPSCAKRAKASSSSPRFASSITQTRSASCAPLHAADTMARSSRRFGTKMPGVSTRMIWASPSMTMPRTSERVVCTLLDTIEIFEPTSALISVDLPTLGAPISAANPQRVARGCAAASGSTIDAARHALARQELEGSRLLRRALAAADAFGRLQAGQDHLNTEARVVMRPGPLDLTIGRRRQAAALRPLLQHGLRIAQRAHWLAQAIGPRAVNEFGRRLVAAVNENRADHRFADVAEHGLSQALGRADRAELDALVEAQRSRDIGTSLPAHQVGQTLRQLALVALRKRAEQHVGYRETKH